MHRLREAEVALRRWEQSTDLKSALRCAEHVELAGDLAREIEVALEGPQ
jgi:hypothetical protein